MCGRRARRAHMHKPKGRVGMMRRGEAPAPCDAGASQRMAAARCARHTRGERHTRAGAAPPALAPPPPRRSAASAAQSMRAAAGWCAPLASPAPFAPPSTGPAARRPNPRRSSAAVCRLRASGARLAVPCATTAGSRRPLPSRASAADAQNTAERGETTYGQIAGGARAAQWWPGSRPRARRGTVSFARRIARSALWSACCCRVRLCKRSQKEQRCRSAHRPGTLGRLRGPIAGEGDGNAGT